MTAFEVFGGAPWRSSLQYSGVRQALNRVLAISLPGSERASDQAAQ